MKIIDRVFTLMEKKGIRSVDLAQALDVRTSVISNWKSRRSDPPASQLIQICELLDVSIEYLLTGTDTSQNKSCSKQNIHLNKEEKEILDLWHELFYENKIIIKGKMYELKKEQLSKNNLLNKNFMVAE